MSYAYIVDPSFTGVISGWTSYITGSDALTMFFVFLFLLVLGLIFHIDVSVILVFMLPFTLTLMAYSVSALFGGFVLVASIVILALGFYWVKRF